MLVFENNLVNDIWNVVFDTLYPEKDSYKKDLEIWKDANDIEFKSYEEAIAWLSAKIENFPEINVEAENDRIENNKIVENFENTLSHNNEEDYKVAVFTETENYLANSDIKQTKNMYVRNATNEEIEANKVIVTENDKTEIKNKFGEVWYITFTSENLYKWGEATSPNSIKVFVKDNNIFYDGINIGNVGSNNEPNLKITSMASRFFRMKTISAQDAKVEGGNYKIVSNEELEKLINDRNDFESKLIVISSRLGISKIDQVSAMQMSQKVVELLDYNNAEANKAKEELRIATEKAKSLEIEVNALRNQIESMPKQNVNVEVKQEKEIIDIHQDNPLYVAYFKGKNNQRRYLVVNGKKLQHTEHFEKASKLPKTELLPSVIKLATEKRIQFVIAKIKFEIQ